jgi:hypothetical protein
MKELNGFRIIAGVLLAVGLIAAATAIGWMAYNAGLSQGAAQAGGVPSASAANGAFGAYSMPAFGLGWLGCLVPLAFLWLTFSLFRLVAWGSMRRRMHEDWGPRGTCMPGGMRGVWQQRVEEWHRQAHAAESGGAQTGQPSA